MLDGLMQGADRDLVKIWQKLNAKRFDNIMLKTKTVGAVARPEGIEVTFAPAEEGGKVPAPQTYDLVLAHDPATALEQQEKRQAKMNELQTLANAWVGTLDEQDQGAKKRGRKLSDSGAKARFYHEVRESHLGNIIKVNLKDDLFSYAVDEGALKLAQMMDGKLLVVTNVKDIEPQKIIERYKSLADIERGFKVLKSELEIGPVYHRLPQRIRAHASICFMALILHRVMRMRLRAGNTGVTPERALQTLKRIQHHRVSINGAQPLSGVSSITEEDSKVFKALKVKLPSQTQQMSLL